MDLAVHFVKASGGRPKIFKLARVSLPPRGRVELRTTVSLAVHTTRRPRPGTHAVDVVVNGTAMPAGSFEVLATRLAQPVAGPSTSGARKVRQRRARNPVARERSRSTTRRPAFP